MSAAVAFKGEEFAPREKVNHMRIMALASMAQDEAGGAVMNQWAALYKTVEHILRAEDFDRFMAACDREGVDIGELYEFVGKMLGALAERPTVQPSASSAGPSPAPENSATRLETLATERYPGRPDLVMAATAQERVSVEETAQVLDLWAAAS
jgi:hypothetical protein